MTRFSAKLRLKEHAEEDIYFAKRDRELIRALREKRLSTSARCSSEKDQQQARSFEKQFDRISNRFKKKKRKRFKAYQQLIGEILEACGKLHNGV